MRSKCVIVDWQQCCRGLPTVDLAWIVGAAMSEKQRRDHASTLLQQYHKRMMRQGKRNPRSAVAHAAPGVPAAYTYADEFMTDFRLGLLLVFSQVCSTCIGWRAMFNAGETAQPPLLSRYRRGRPLHGAVVGRGHSRPQTTAPCYPRIQCGPGSDVTQSACQVYILCRTCSISKSLLFSVRLSAPNSTTVVSFQGC